MSGLKIPISASEIPTPDGLPEEGEAYIQNPYAGKELLTPNEALDLVHVVIGEIIADRITRG